MRLILDQIPQLLCQQYQELWETASTCASVNEFWIDDLAVTILVKMEHIVHTYQKGVVFSGGKLYKNLATVKIIPANERVEQVVIGHFENHIIPALMTAPAMTLFEQLVINGRQIKLRDL
jgi:hypothetical protein